MSSGDSIAPLGAVPPTRDSKVARPTQTETPQPSADWAATVTAATASAPGPDIFAQSPASPKSEGLQMLEGLILKSLVETMLPDETSELFGKGSAGRMWRSMLAEQIAQTMVEDGRLQLLTQDAVGREVRTDVNQTQAPRPLTPGDNR